MADDPIEFTEWFKLPNYGAEVCNGTMTAIATAMNGRKLRIQVYGTAVVNRGEEHLKEVKKEQAKQSIMDYFRGLKGRRIGVPGYRGYFRIKYYMLGLE